MKKEKPFKFSDLEFKNRFGSFGGQQARLLLINKERTDHISIIYGEYAYSQDGTFEIGIGGTFEIGHSIKKKGQKQSDWDVLGYQTPEQVEVFINHIKRKHILKS